MTVLQFQSDLSSTTRLQNPRARDHRANPIFERSFNLRRKRPLLRSTAALQAAVEKRPAICTADELHYVDVPDSDWRLALWRYLPPAQAPARNHPLLLLSGMGTSAIGFDLVPEGSFARYMAGHGYDTWTLELRGIGLSTLKSIDVRGNYEYGVKNEPKEKPPLGLGNQPLSFNFIDNHPRTRPGSVKSGIGIKKTLDLFSASSGLHINYQKSKIFFSGVSDTGISEILLTLGMQKGDLPVKYLGVPLSGSRLTKDSYKPLSDKILQIIKSWSCKFLSYAGRLQLIKAVAFSVQNYWSVIFPIPKGVLQFLDQRLRAFMWGGNADSNKAPIAWSRVCLPKDQGGLGIYGLVAWNLTAQAKKIWRLYSDKLSLWIKWVHIFYIKRADFWTMICPKDTTAAVGALFKCRVVLKDIFQLLQIEKQPSFSMKNIYLQIVENFEPVAWKRLVWGPKHSPRASMIAWFCHMKALYTSDKIALWKPDIDTTCVLCSDLPEDSDHLFFNCCFSGQLLTEGLKIVNLRNPPLQFDQLCIWMNKVTRGKSFKAKIRRSYFASLIYSIWQERNYRKF